MRRRVVAWTVLVLIGVSLGWIGRGCGDSADRPESSHASHVDGAVEAEAAPVVWTCSMHPQIRLPEQTPCPLCGMDLVPVESDDGEGDPRALTLSPAARKLASVRTSPVRRAPASREIRLTGIVRADETREREISAWIAGRIEKLHVDYTGGSVRRGQSLLDLYSPELLSAQEELLQAVHAGRGSTGATSERASTLLARTEKAAREKLRLLGLSEGQIESIVDRGEARAVVTIPAPLSGVVLEKKVQAGQTVKVGETLYRIADLSRLWLELEAYESDLPWIATGDEIVFETDAYPGESFQGTVSFLEPTADAVTRTVRVRVVIENEDGRLKPSMFARASVHSRLRAEDGTDPLVIPATAPLLTGRRAIVYVADPGEEGRFQAREVVLGPKAGEVYVVREGLRAGDEVVSRGAFKIDSALQIRAGDSMMSRHPGGRIASGSGGSLSDGSGSGGSSSGGTHSGRARSSEPVRFLTVPADFHQSIGTIFSAYFDLSEQLSQDRAREAREAFGNVVSRARSAEGDGLDPQAFESWQRMRKEILRIGKSLDRELSGITDGNDPEGELEQLRSAFRPLSDLAIEVTSLFGPAGADSVFTYHCPMAFSDQGADWLQRRRGVENPYYGASMFRCGSETRNWTEDAVQQKRMKTEEPDGTAR